jgi:hypothetical protein
VAIFHRIGDSGLQDSERGLVCVDRSRTVTTTAFGEVQGYLDFTAPRRSANPGKEFLAV